MDANEGSEVGVILVADDDPQVRRIMGRMLEQAGFEVLLASHSEEAIEIFRTAYERIQVAILDLGLEREGGVATFERMREISSDFGVLFASGGVPSEELRQRLREIGGVFLAKPFRAAALHEEVTRLIDARPS